MSLIPVGCRSLPEALERFRFAKYGNNDPVSELQNQRYLMGSDDFYWRRRSALEKVHAWDLRRMMEAFYALGGDSLEAQYFAAGYPERMRLPAQFWRDSETAYRERLFWEGGAEILPSQASEGSPYIGATPFVELASLDTWISGYLEAQAQDCLPSNFPRKPPLLLAGFLLDLVRDGTMDERQAEQHRSAWLLPPFSHPAVIPLSFVSEARLTPEDDNALSFMFAQGHFPTIDNAPSSPAPVAPNEGPRKTVRRADLKKGLMKDAVNVAFPEGVPIAVLVKERDSLLDEAFGALARSEGVTLPPPKDREWRRLFSGR